MAAVLRCGGVAPAGEVAQPAHRPSLTLKWPLLSDSVLLVNSIAVVLVRHPAKHCIFRTRLLYAGMHVILLGCVVVCVASSIPGALHPRMPNGCVSSVIFTANSWFLPSLFVHVVCAC